MSNSPIKSGGRYLTCKLLEGLDFLVHGFGTRQDGAGRNGGLLCQALGIAPQQVFTINQVHGNGVLVVDEPLLARWRGGQLKQPILADALLTNQPGVALAVLTADCLPIITVDTEKRAVAIVHAGWRGTYQGVSQRALSRLAECWGGSPGNWLVGMGPCIGNCCYEVGAEVADIFSQRFSAWRSYCIPDKGGKWKLDLITANRDQLLSLGVRPENIGEVGWCTACNPEHFFSHRRTPGVSGRMMSLVMLK